ncbi:uncharacterized protein KY384_001448 [Bacidia gigantensis]|uniref:uncharacterized protein n=1 Tax=Bacidia gigantensis TaxID=2732470 RepID=UPI001D0468B7|nr:uncharacterized protein KY384_001448 [Bacidia gigantensis]KAG8533707.1 hypothetical protein KY384_001448 [Bacidia gigantensis]
MAKQDPLTGDLLLVIHDFEARSSDELSLYKGDKIELIERDDDFGDGWYLGKHTKTNKTGLFPEVYTTLAPKQVVTPTKGPVSVTKIAAANASNLHTHISSPQPGPERISTANATPPPLNTNSPVQKTSSVSSPSLPALSLSGIGPGQRSISMVQHDAAEDSPVINETLSVIDEHMTDMQIPRPEAQELEGFNTRDSASEYSSFPDYRISYIAGQETDEEEHNMLTEQEVMTWTPSHVAEHLEDMGVESKHCDIFKEQDISGEVLLALDQSAIFMKEFNLGLVGQRLRTWHKIKALQDEVHSRPTPVPKTRPIFNGNPSYDSSESGMGAVDKSRSSRTRYKRASTNPPPSRQDFADPLPSPSMQMALSQARDSNSTPSSFTFKQALDSPSRPSAASIREFNHSRRHSAADFASTFGPGTPTEQSSPALPPSNASVRPQSQHKKTPSLDRNWTMGGPLSSLSPRPMSSAHIGNSFAIDRRTPESQARRASHMPSSSRDLDRGYKSGDELDARRSRNVLRKRETVGASHSRQSSYQGNDQKAGLSPAKRHSRFGSVDSIKDTVAAIALPGNRLHMRGHSRGSSTGDPIVRTEATPGDTSSPAVTKLEYSSRPHMKIVTSSSNRDSGVGIKSSPKLNTGPPRAGNKPRMGLRAISDAVTGNEKSIAASPPSVPSPKIEPPYQSPARTGSTTPSGASQSLDRESTDASSKGTSGAQTTLTPTSGTRKKTKKETSAYTRGLEQKPPQEQMIDCDYSGWMKKKSSNMMTTWKQRLFVLRGRRLSYYYSEDDISEKGLIDISSHRVLPADNDILTGLHATVTGAKSSPISPPTAHTPTLAQTEAAAQTESTLRKEMLDSTFIFKLVPPRSGLSRAVNFTKPTVHYFAVDNIRQGRLWMAALMKATIDRDESKPITTSYQLKTISLAKARTMRQRPPALMNLDEQSEGVQDGPKSDETGLNIQGVEYDRPSMSEKRAGSLDSLQKSQDNASLHEEHEATGTEL